MWLRNVQDVLIRFDTYIIHPEDVQIVSEKLCDLRSFPASWGPMKQASIQAFLTALSASASILSRSIFGFAKPKVKKQKRHEVTVTGARCFFFILLKWYVDICCIYIYIYIASTPLSCPGMTSLLVLSVSASRRFRAITSCHNCQNHARKLERGGSSCFECHSTIAITCQSSRYKLNNRERPPLRRC